MSDVLSFEKIIQKDGELIYTSKGYSMYPLIKSGDLIVMEKIQKKLNRFDIVLYKRNNETYVLHRIIKIGKDFCYVCGDNQFKSEKIERKQIIGILKEVERNGNKIELKSFPYMLFYCYLYPLRFVLLYIRRLLVS